MTVDKRNYVLTKEEAQDLRHKYLMGPMREYVRRFMNSFPPTQSVTIKVSQYYDDEASDAVHFSMFPSILPQWEEPPPPKPRITAKGRKVTPPVPDYQGELGASSYEDRDLVKECLSKNLPFIKFEPWRSSRKYNPSSLRGFISDWSDIHFGWKNVTGWEANGASIPLFAAYCYSDGDYRTAAPLCVYSRTIQGQIYASDLDMTMLGEQLRPEMDGISPKEGECQKDVLFEYTLKCIEMCSIKYFDPLSDIKEQIQRQDLFSREDELKYGSNFLSWTLKGPGIINEDEAKKVAQCPEALREIQAEWDRRKEFDAAFKLKYRT